MQSGPQGGSDVVTEQTYNNLGLVDKTAYPHFVNTPAAWMTYVYDSFSRPSVVTQPDGLVQNIEYLKGELQVRSTLAKGSADERSNTVYRSVREAITQTVGRNGGTTTRQYDPLAQPSQSIGPNGDITTFKYDSLGRMIGSTSADTGEKQFIYNDKGQLSSIKAPDNKTVSYAYDALGRILQQSVLINGQAYAYFYSYDSAAVQNGLGQLAQVQMPTATQNFTAYSRDGELQQESLVIDGLTYVQAYEYSPGGERTRLVYPDGAELNTGYDAAGNITTQDFKDNAQASSRQVANYSRYSAGNQVLNVAFANGVNTAFDYFSYAENMARPKSMIVTLSGGVAYSNAYDWNQVGQLAASTTLHGNNPSVK